MNFETLRKSSTERCRATCDDPQSHGGPCVKRASYKINGVPLCRRHGGSVVLDLLTEEEQRDGTT